MSSLRKKKFPATVKDIISMHIPKIYVLRGESVNSWQTILKGKDLKYKQSLIDCQSSRVLVIHE